MVLLLFFAGILTGCNHTSKNNVTGAVSENADTTILETKTVVQQASVASPGKAAFTKYCVVCHQINASGVPGTFPPLAKGSWTDKAPEELIAIVLKGLKGEITVNGETYKNEMPPQSQLTDEEVANVLSYIRSNFGNQFDSVSPEMVKKVRLTLKKQK